MNRSTNLLSAINIVFCIVNIIIFFLWLSLVRVEAIRQEMSTYIYNHLTIQFTILEILLAIVSLTTAIIAIFGFQTIKNSAENKTVEIAETYLRTETPRLIKEEIEKRVSERKFFNLSNDYLVDEKNLKDKSKEKGAV